MSIKEEGGEKEEKEKKEEKENKEESYPPNLYRYNLQGSFPKSPLGPSPLKREREVPNLEEIDEKISELEAISKACVNTIGEGIDAYWMMSKDFEQRVDLLYDRINTLTKVVLEILENNKLLMKVVSGQQEEIMEISARFLGIARSCNWKNVKNPTEEKEEKAPAEPKENQVF